MNTECVRLDLANELNSELFVQDKSGSRVIELVGTSFVADEDSIFGKVSGDYVERELAWYKSMSLDVFDIPPPVPEIWEKVADDFGYVNSNYGFLIWSDTNYNQYERVLETLKKDPTSRRAVMIYTRPSMHLDYNRNGMSDFICTNTVGYLVREGKLNAIVNMRSNDAVFGYKNDYHWQKHVLDSLARDLDIEAGSIHWQTMSIHVYERHFYLVDHYSRTGEIYISKSEYADLYPNSKWINA